MRVLTVEKATGSVTWDRTNDNSDQVASGVYMYLIKDSLGNKLHGKVAIIQ